MSGAWTFRYFLAKVAVAAGDIVQSLATSHGAPWSTALQGALAKGMDTYLKEMSTVIHLAGAAMTPTLNARATTHAAAVDSLLMRIIPRPSSSNVYVGDVVAFHAPFRDEGDQGVMVRRVAAMEGQEMTSDDPEDVPFRIPVDHCWVLADNQVLSHPDVIDSRSFGPLAIQRICGRIMYNGYSRSDHGIVQNSDQAMLDDQPILQCEFDPKKMFPDSEE